jgi:hypothetical protein
VVNDDLEQTIKTATTLIINRGSGYQPLPGLTALLQRLLH